MLKIVRSLTYILIIGLPLQGLILHLVPKFKFWKETVLFLLIYITIIFALFVVQKRNYKIINHISIIDQLLLLYIIYIGIRALLSKDILVGLIGFGTYTTYIILYFLIIVSFNSNNIFKLIDWIIVSAVIVAAFGLVQAFFSPTAFGLLDEPMKQSIGEINIGRLTSTFGTPLDFGAYIALVTPLVLARLLLAKNLAKRAILLVIVIVFIISIALTFTRTAWIQLIVSFLVITWGLFSKKRFRKYIWLTGFIIVVIIVGINLFISSDFSSQTLTTRFYSIFDWQHDLSNLQRIERWENSLELLNGSSFLFGIGPGTTMNRANFYYKTGIICPESYILQLLIELGIFALIVFLMIFIYFIKQGVNLYKNTTINEKSSFTALAITAAIFGLGINFIVSLSFNNWSILSVFWLGCAYLSLQQKYLYQQKKSVENNR
ncbi:O-antigen ligase family protein [Patescibacteria group bacterium]|nr:O-antigen ligase family protein [Patescibacteria group bacterium]